MTSPSEGVTFADLIALGLSRTPDRLCFVSENQSVSYAQMRHQAFSMARALADRGIEHGDGVTVLLPNRPELLAVMSAVLLRGCRYTPLHPLASADDQAFIVRDSESSLLVYDADLADRAEEIIALSGCPDAVSIGPSDRPDLAALAEAHSGATFRPEVSEHEIATLSYTGGTTGRPKGVVMPHRGRVQNVMMTLADWQLPSVMRVLLPTPMSHSAGTMLVPTLLRGGTIYSLTGFDPGEVLRSIETNAITCVLGVPTALYSLLDHPALPNTDTSSLETFIYGSSPISSARLEEAMAKLGPVFMQLYGQTEAPNTVTVLRKEDHDLSRPHLLTSCGQPMAGVRVQVQRDDGTEASVGENGEICVQGRIVMDGYWNRPEETAEALKGGWLHTGDVANSDETGYLYIVDRLKDTIISGGYNVYPREVEDVLEGHPGVAAAAVIGVPHDRWGEAVKACVVLRNDVELSGDELISYVKKLKGSIQAPKSIDFITQMPTTAVGKPDKKALRERYWHKTVRQVN